MKAEQFATLMELDIIPNWMIKGWESRHKSTYITNVVRLTRSASIESQKSDVYMFYGSICTFAFLLMMVIFEPSLLLSLLSSTGFLIYVIWAIEKHNSPKILTNLQNDPLLVRIDELASALNLKKRELFGMCAGDVRKLCSEHLKARAFQIVDLQERCGQLNHFAEAARDAFKKTHSLFLSFSLVEEKWDVYFIKTTSTPPSEVPGTASGCPGAE